MKKSGGNVFSLCLEKLHYNQLAAKLFNILALGRVKKVGFLTVDGSPHCIQMHFASKYLKRGLKEKVEFKHYVVAKDGDVFKVQMEEIDKARNLSAPGERVEI